MLCLKNDVNSLKELLEKKSRVVLYGAGASAKLLIKSYHHIFPKKSLEFIVDGNETLDGKFCVVDEKIRIKILSLNHFCQLEAGRLEGVTFLFTPYYSLFFIKQLDLLPELHGVETYVYSFIANNLPPRAFELRNLDRPAIPKIIHYFWIGGSELPEEYQRNIRSWRRFCPDYQIMKWDESNYDFGKYRYAREALESKQYMYATDVARKEVLYTYGGIYFDTDVELLSPLDDLLYNEAFIGIDDGGQVNSGSGLGCVKHHPIIGEMLKLYEDKEFIRADGSFCAYYNTFYETELLIRKGYQVKNEYQMIQGVSCFPREVFMPDGVVGAHRCYTDKTVADHKINPYDKAQIASVRNRLYGGSTTDAGQRGRKKLALYGAGMVAVSVRFAIKSLYQSCDIVCFIVTEKHGNPSVIDGLPVISLDEFATSGRNKTDVKILIAVPENHHRDIRRLLEQRDLKDYLCIDSRREAALMEAYYEKTGQFPGLHQYPAGDRPASLEVYMSKCHKDMPLKKFYILPPWIYTVQAGAALTNERIGEVQDNTGIHISEKNVNYSELSALYWVWRNVGDTGGHSDYLGLFHYRRILDVTEEDLSRIKKNGIDVILPYPTVHAPSIAEHHKRYVKDPDWAAMVQALEELAPKYGDALRKLLTQSYFYNYNIFIARKNIFQQFCGWLFPILERTEELSCPKGWERADRYMGYLGESLTTLYFLYHRQDLKIAHTGRLMLI